MTEHLLDRHQVHAPLVVMSGARPPQRMRAEPVCGIGALEFQQVPQPVADRATVQPPAGLISEQHRRVREPGPHVAQEPLQQHVQPVKHRHPPRPRARRPRRLAEPHMQLAERAAAEMQVRPVEHRRLVSAQPRVIQGAEQGVVPCGRAVLAGGGDPAPQEREESLQPCRRRRRQLRRRVIPDMPGGVELIDRALQPHPEHSLDLPSLAGGQEPVEALERLHIATPCRGGQPARRQRPRHPVDVLRRDLPRRTAQQREHPLQHPGVVLDRHRAEPAHRPRRHIRLHALVLEPPRISADSGSSRSRTPRDHPQPPPVHPGTPSSRHENQGDA